MSSPLVWVIGRGGLLGNAVESEVIEQRYRPFLCEPFVWQSPQFLSDLESAIGRFEETVSVMRTPWSICWCAGAGVVGTRREDLQRETRTFKGFLEILASKSKLSGMPGTLFLASSAGGIYAGSAQSPISEKSAPVPISDYGREKLEQERALAAFAGERQEVHTLVGRFANLYGPGQRLDKPQGLISHISRCLVFGTPVHIYVGLDTLRDYLYASDAARMVLKGVSRLQAIDSDSQQQIVKIYGSEREISIAGLLGLFRGIAKRRLRLVTGSHSFQSQQPRKLVFRSAVWPDDGALAKVGLLDGISRIYRHQVGLRQSGRLPPP